MIYSHTCSGRVHVYRRGFFMDVLIVASWYTVVIAGYQTQKGHYRPSAAVWDTQLIHQCIITHGSANGEKEKIYWPKLVDGLASGVMYGRCGIRVGRGKINTGQYQRPIDSNILCGKQIEAAILPQFILSVFLLVFQVQSCCEQAVSTRIFLPIINEGTNKMQ